MTVEIEVFGSLADLLGGARHRVDLPPEGATVHDATARLVERYPALEDALPTVALAIGARIVRPDEPLADGETVSLLPPVSGG